MVKNKYILLIWLLLLPMLDTFAQDNRYLVFFTDKLNSPFEISAPQDFLAQKSIERRQKNQVQIDESDIPVNASYIQQVKDLDIAVFHQSKWLNAILVETSPDKVAQVEGLAVVDRVDLVAPGAILNSRVSNSNKFEVENTATGTLSNDVTDAQNRMLGVTFMHDQGFEGQDITIGVFDGGFLGADNQPYLSHIFDDNRVLATYDFVNNIENVFTIDNHGTRALACIGAFVENQIIGTAPEANFVLCISEEVATEFRVEEYNWIFAAEFADSIGVDIISTSLGYNTFDDPSMNYTVADMDGETTVISVGAQMAADKGILLINSAGNSGNDASWQIITAPGDVDDMITVGAIQSDSTKSSFSSIGPAADGRVKPDVVALGTNTIVGFNESNDTPVVSSGTSFSAPLVAGLAAGLMQAFPNATKDEIIDKMRTSGHQANNTDELLGYGIPSFIRATDFVVGIDKEINDQIQLFPNPTLSTINLSISAAAKKKYASYAIYAVDGKVMKSAAILDQNGSDLISIDTQNLPKGMYMIKLVGDSVFSTRFIKQ